MKIIKKPESINVITVGNPTISDDYIVSNFSTSNWIKESTNYTLQYNDVIEINLRYKCNSYGPAGIYLGSVDIYLKDRATNRFEYYFGASGGYSTFYISHSLGNWYRLKIIQEYKSSGSAVTFSLSSDEGQTWTTATTTISYSSIPTFDNIILGQHPDSTSEYLRGELDLKECNIKINDNYIWQGVTPEKYYYIKQPYSANATINGSLTIDSDLIVSNFSVSNYMYIPTDFTLTSNDTVELNIKAKKTGMGTGWCLLTSMLYSMRSDHGKIETGGNNQWEIYYDTCHEQGNSGYYTTLNTWYWYKIIINNSTKTISLYGSTTGAYNGEEDLIKSGTFTNIITSWYFRIGSDGGNSQDLGYGNYWDGQIDMKATNLKINNDMIWDGIKYKYYGIRDNIPSQYQKVDYIQSSGTQYINTGISAPNGFKIKTKISMSNSDNAWGCLCGSHESSSPYKRNFVMINYNQRLSNAGVVSCGQGDGDKYARDGSIHLITIYDIKASNIYNNTYIKINGENKTLTTEPTPTNSYSSRNLYIFANNNGSSLSNPSQYFAGKMYATKIIVNDNIVRNYIPVLNTLTNKFGFYDTISEQFFGNSGSGNFTGGKDLNPPANVIFDEVDNNNYITYKTQDGQSYWRKSYSGLCYGGFCVFEDGGNNWIVAFTISEVQNNCIMYRDSNQNITLTISSTALNYKGKNWYYSINGYANIYNNPSSTIIDFNKNNGRYWIGGENKIYTGSDNNEKFIKVAKDFLDYIYSF